MTDSQTRREPDGRTLLVVSGGAEAVPGIRKAKEMGLHVVVSDWDPDAPGFALADDKLIASTYNALGTAASAARYNRDVRRIDGVMCIAADVPRTVAVVAKELGLPGIPIEAAELAADKIAMKRRLASYGVPVPWFEKIDGPAHLKRVVLQQGPPLIIKPVDSRGARGVMRIGPGIDLNWAYEQAKEHSPTGRVMVERYLTGPQQSTESVLLDGRGYTLGFADRNYARLEQFAPFVIEDGGEQPTALTPEQRAEAARVTVEAGLALGIRTGTVKGDIVWHGGKAWVIEVAARLSGGWFSTDQIPLATGVDLVEVAIRLALGDPVTEADVTPSRERGVAIRYLFPPPGHVVRVEGAEEAEAEPWVHKLHLFVQPGDRLDAVTNHTRRAGLVITEGADRAEAVARAEEIVRRVRVITEE